MSFSESAQNAALLQSLTPREKQLLDLLLTGLTLETCARRLGITYATANTHINAIYKKLGVNSRAALILKYANLK